MIWVDLGGFTYSTWNTLAKQWMGGLIWMSYVLLFLQWRPLVRLNTHHVSVAHRKLREVQSGVVIQYGDDPWNPYNYIYIYIIYVYKLSDLFCELWNQQPVLWQPDFSIVDSTSTITKVHMTAKLPTPFQADDLLQGQGALPSDAVLTTDLTDLSCDLRHLATLPGRCHKSTSPSGSY